MKKLSVFTLTAAVILCVLACVLCACNTDDIPSGVPVGWKTYLNEVADCFADDIDECGNTVNVNLKGSIVVDGSYYSLTARANYDTVNRGASNVAVILKNADKQVVASVLTDNENTYIDIAQNPYTDNAKLKLQETCIFDWLADVNYEGISAGGGFKKRFLSFGDTFFRNANVNADKTKYTFNIKGDAIGERLYDYFMALYLIDDNIASVILNILGVRDLNAILSACASADGNINFYVKDGSVYKIDADNLTFDGGSNGSVVLDLGIKGTYDETVADLFPDTDTGYKVTKVGSTALDGSLAMISSVGNKHAVKYSLGMNTNIDLLKLTFNAFDLNALSDDNFFHFRLSHKCDETCTEYCASRLSASNGAVLDIAFSPEHFGTTNVYISINLHAFLSKNYVERVSRYDKSITPATIPEYAMIVLPASNLSDDNAFMKLMFQFYSHIMGIEVGSSENVDLNEIHGVFENIRVADVLFENIFASEEYSIDTLKIKVDGNIYGQARDYDIYKEVVYLKAYDEPSIKSYSTGLGKDRTAYSWSYEPKKTAAYNGEKYILNNIYDADGSNLLHGVNAAGDYVPMSDREIEDLMNSTLKLEYVGYGGAADSAYCAIVGVEGLDADCFDVQQVTLKVKYPNLFDYTFEIGDIAENVLEDLFGGGSETFVQDVRVNIKLTRESSEDAFDFRSADTSKKYRITYNSSVPEMLKATALIKYENGLQKKIVTIGDSSSVIESMGLFIMQYSVVDWGKITVKFRVAGRNVDRYFEVEKPDKFEFVAREGSEEIGKSCSIASFVTLKAVYDDETVNVKLTFKDFYINDICLDDDAAEWDHYYSYTSKNLVFNKSNDYVVNVKKCGIDFGSFVLHITSTSAQRPSYQYNVKTEPQAVVLTGARNAFSGTISNKTHGDGDDKDYNLDIKVYEYYAADTGMSYAEASPEDYSLSLTVGGETTDSGKIQVSLPAMIISPINVRFSVAFAKAGIYRITVRLNTTTVLYNFIISVL